MIRTALTVLLSATVYTAAAQPYAIGNTTREWNDTARARAVAAELHYPAAVEGDDQPVADGAFPVLVLGHGFVMGVDAYVYVWQHFVPLGYIVILPTTEGGILPDHAAFGEDLAFCVRQMQVEDGDTASVFFEHVGARSALLGHSMGGGATFLGAEGNTDIHAVVTMAPAETDPSAIAAAAGVLVPTLLFAATEDCVTPVATNQQPMYDALVPCKALVNVTGGGHCYFGDPNFLCDFGEFTCGPDLSISREEQHDVVTDLSTLWLDHYLRDDPAALVAFVDSMATTTRASTQYACLSTGMAAHRTAALRVWPSPTTDVLHIEGVGPDAWVRVVDALGRSHAVRRFTGTPAGLDVSTLPDGHYRLVWPGDDRLRSMPFVVAH